MTISKDRVKPSPLPDSWKLKEIFATGVVLGSYMALMTAIFFWAAYETNFFTVNFSADLFRLIMSAISNFADLESFILLKERWNLCQVKRPRY